MKQLGLEVPERRMLSCWRWRRTSPTEAPSGPMYGLITRFDKYWDLPYLTFGTMLQ